MTETEPTEERWAYGGIPVLHTERMFAWLPDAGSGEEQLFRPMKGRYTVGLLYRVFVTRTNEARGHARLAPLRQPAGRARPARPGHRRVPRRPGVPAARAVRRGPSGRTPGRWCRWSPSATGR